MTRTAIILTLLLNVIAGPASAASPQFPPATTVPTDARLLKVYQEVAAADAGAGHAIYTRSYADLDNYWAPEFIVNGPGNHVLNRADVIAAIGAGKLAYHDYHNVPESIAVIGDNVIEMGHENYIPATGPDAGKTLFRRYTQFYARRAGKLLLIARQATIYDPSAVHY